MNNKTKHRESGETERITAGVSGFNHSLDHVKIGNVRLRIIEKARCEKLEQQKLRIKETDESTRRLESSLINRSFIARTRKS